MKLLKNKLNHETTDAKDCLDVDNVEIVSCSRGDK